MKKRAADVNQLGKLIVGLATGEETEDLEPSKRQIAGRASAAKLTLQERSERARKAAAPRWAFA